MRPSTHRRATPLGAAAFAAWFACLGGPAHAAAPASQPVEETGFSFGSYGRVGAGYDMHGHEGYATNVVSHGSRLEEPPYVQLDLYYRGLLHGDPRRQWTIVVTPAFLNGDLFHYTGDLHPDFVLRNAYVETDNIGLDGLSLWMGSRMYRGDDAYLFDYWPLDNLNTVGGGAAYAWGKYIVAVHTGLNRLDDPFEYQTIGVPAPGLGPAVQATVLDRPRSVSSFELTRFFGGFPGAKVSLYGEFHVMPGGNQVIEPNSIVQPVPRDYGWVAGLQLGGWLRPFVFANVWMRAAGGLAAYGELTDPSELAGLDLDPTRSVDPAREYLAAFSSNWESRHLGVMAAGYVRRFVDPAPGPYNPRSYTERIIAVRPYLYLSNWAATAFELSYQSRAADGLDYTTGRRLVPRVFRASIMPTVSPTGRGTYARPQIYLVYTVSAMNQDALDFLYPTQDFRHGYSVVQYIGMGAEWWFNSTYR